jgi:hypothetical protein
MTSAWGYRISVSVRLYPWSQITTMLPNRLQRCCSPGSGPWTKD